jgi:hypothetical protein
MKYIEILEIKNALTDLSKERLFVAYEIAKNIRRCNAAIEETQAINKALVEKFCDKDAEGNPKNYPVEGRTDQTQLKITDAELLKQYQEEWIKALDADHTIDFVKIPKMKIQSANLVGSTLVPLVDVIIEE